LLSYTLHAMIGACHTTVPSLVEAQQGMVKSTISVYTFLYLQGMSDSTSNVADKRYKGCSVSGNPKIIEIKYLAIATLNVPHLLQ